MLEMMVWKSIPLVMTNISKNVYQPKIYMFGGLHSIDQVGEKIVSYNGVIIVDRICYRVTYPLQNLPKISNLHQFLSISLLKGFLKYSIPLNLTYPKSSN